MTAQTWDNEQKRPGVIGVTPAMGTTLVGGHSMAKSTCSVDGCDRVVQARGWCHPHYARWHTYGDLRLDVPMVRRIRGPKLDPFWSRVDRSGGPDACWPMLGTRGDYGRVLSGGRRVGAHRWAWEQAHGPIPVGMVVMHGCDNPPCVNVAHLSLGTQMENIADRVRKGRSARGACNPGKALA